jgi:hypothetical protein
LHYTLEFFIKAAPSKQELRHRVLFYQCSSEGLIINERAN